MNVEKLTEKIKRNPKVTIISVVSFIIVLILIIVLIVSSSNSSKKHSKSPDKKDKDLIDEEYYNNSILKKIKINLLATEATLNIYNLTYQNGKPKKELMNTIKEVYDFQSRMGKQNLEYYENEEKIWTHDILTESNVYTRGIYEIYEIDKDSKICNSFDQKSGETVFNFYLGNWFPKAILADSGLQMVISKLSKEFNCLLNAIRLI